MVALVQPPTQPKDCACETHDEPHFWHVTQIWLTHNRAAFENAVTRKDVFGIYGFMFAEEDRLRVLEGEMKAYEQKHSVVFGTPEEEATHA